MRISDWSSDVCSSDLAVRPAVHTADAAGFVHGVRRGCVRGVLQIRAPPRRGTTMRDSVKSGGVIQMSHGAGGRDMAELIERMFVTAFANPHLSGREDQAVLDLPAGRLAMSTDSYVVSPLFCPGGDIGSLAVNGTINDELGRAHV